MPSILQYRGRHSNGASGHLARIFHEDVLQAQQPGSWQGFVDFDPAGNAVGIPLGSRQKGAGRVLPLPGHHPPSRLR